MFLKKSTIGIKLISGFATALIVLLLAGWQMYRSLEGYIDTSHWVNHTYQALEALGELTSDIAKVENGHYAFIITGEDFYLTERESEKDRIIKTLENIRRLTIDNPRQQLRIARLEQSVREHLEFLERNIEIFRTQGREVVRDRIKRGISRLSMEALLNQITMIEEEERALLVNRNQKAESDAHWAKSVGLLLTTIAVAGIFLLWLPTRYADRELRNSEAMLQQILDLLPVGVTVCNPIGQITRTNPAMKEIWGGVRYVDIEQYDEYKGWWP
ncbi:MAG: CHASE3 domain-containing protein, partial [Gammaproteobacteria bacterium]|nr:CHASE3 domain-containing protein [Gammaproteobacteria bacterium]